ncbi:type 4 pilus biogenesis, partial [Thauera phenylacetica B4P]
APAPTAAPAPAPKPAPKSPAAPVAAAEPAAAPSLVDTLMEDPALLYGGGGILALLLAYAGLKARQRRKEEEIRAAEAALGAASVGTGGQSVFAGTGGQSVDTGATSIMHTDFSHSGLSAIDADEGVDPVAEADVYMAYGRDAQAEEILQDALKADPARAAIYLKLLEIYAQRRNNRQFETVASELFARTGGQGRDWEKAAALGRRLDPENPLYATEPGEAVAQRVPQGQPAVAPTPAAAAVAVAGAVAGSAAAAAAAA